MSCCGKDGCPHQHLFLQMLERPEDFPCLALDHTLETVLTQSIPPKEKWLLLQNKDSVLHHTLEILDHEVLRLVSEGKLQGLFQS